MTDPDPPRRSGAVRRTDLEECARGGYHPYATLRNIIVSVAGPKSTRSWVGCTFNSFLTQLPFLCPNVPIPFDGVYVAKLSECPGTFGTHTVRVNSFNTAQPTAHLPRPRGIAGIQLRGRVGPPAHPAVLGRAPRPLPPRPQASPPGNARSMASDREGAGVPRAVVWVTPTDQPPPPGQGRLPATRHDVPLLQTRRAVIPRPMLPAARPPEGTVCPSLPSSADFHHSFPSFDPNGTYFHARSVVPASVAENGFRSSTAHRKVHCPSCPPHPGGTPDTPDTDRLTGTPHPICDPPDRPPGVHAPVAAHRHGLLHRRARAPLAACSPRTRGRGRLGTKGCRSGRHLMGRCPMLNRPPRHVISIGSPTNLTDGLRPPQWTDHTPTSRTSMRPWTLPHCSPWALPPLPSPSPSPPPLPGPAAAALQPRPPLPPLRRRLRRPRRLPRPLPPTHSSAPSGMGASGPPAMGAIHPSCPTIVASSSSAPTDYVEPKPLLPLPPMYDPKEGAPQAPQKPDGICTPTFPPQLGF